MKSPLCQPVGSAAVEAVVDQHVVGGVDGAGEIGVADEGVFHQDVAVGDGLAVEGGGWSGGYTQSHVCGGRSCSGRGYLLVPAQADVPEFRPRVISLVIVQILPPCTTRSLLTRFNVPLLIDRSLSCNRSGEPTLLVTTVAVDPEASDSVLANVELGIARLASDCNVTMD